MPSRISRARIAAAAAVLGVLAGSWLAVTALADGGPSAGPAAAAKARKEPAPKIVEVDPPEQSAGGFVTLRGSGFSIFAEDPVPEEIAAYREVIAAATATVGGVDVGHPNEIADAHVQVQVPAGLPLGKARIELSVAGKKASAEVKVVARAAVPQGEPGPPAIQFLSLDPPQFSTERGRTAVSFAGGADGLPDGSVINLRLTLGPLDVEGGQASSEVKAGRFAGRFGPYAKSLYPALYYVEATFDLQRQSREIRRAFEKAFASDAQGAAQRQHAGARAPVQVGSPEDAAAQARLVRALATTATAEARALLRALAVAYGAAGRGAFTSGGKLDEGAWDAWLERRAYTALPPAERPARRKEMLARREFAGAGGALDAARWRAFVDPLRDEAVAGLAACEALRARFLTLPDPEGARKAVEVWTGLRDVATLWSRELYEGAKLPPDPNDPQLSGRSAGQILVDIAWLEAWLAARARAQGEGK